MGNSGINRNESSKNTSSCRIKYNFTFLVEEVRNGVMQPQQRITMNADCEVSEVRTAVRQIVRGAVEGIADGLGNEDPDPTFEEDPLPEEDPGITP